MRERGRRSLLPQQNHTRQKQDLTVEVKNNTKVESFSL
jgi:hypothetical protein